MRHFSVVYVIAWRVRCQCKNLGMKNPHPKPHERHLGWGTLFNCFRLVRHLQELRHGGSVHRTRRYISVVIQNEKHRWTAGYPRTTITRLLHATGSGDVISRALDGVSVG